MSASTGPSSKGEKGKSKYKSLDINNIYNSSRSETSESQTTKSTIPRKHGMQQLGKVPQRRPPANLPSLKSENSGNDPSISLVPSGGQGWGTKTGESQQLTLGGATGNTNTSQNNQPAIVQNQIVAPTPAPAAGVTPAPTLPSGPPPSQTSSHDKTWSSVTGGSQASSLGVEHGPSFLAHQSPQFRQEFPSLSGEPGGAPAHPTPAYGPGPSLRPQTDPASWGQNAHTKPSSQSQTNHTIPTPFKSVVPSFMLTQGSGGFPMFPEGIQKKPRSQTTHSENRMSSSGPNSSRPMLNNNNQSGSNTGEGEDFVVSRPIIREEELVKMDELTQDSSWAANDDIDYNEQLSFSDGESVGEDEKEKENKLRDKSKNHQSMRDLDRKDETEKSNRDKPFMLERDRNQQAWRVGNNTYSDFRNAPPRQLIPNSRMDDEEIWKEKRRQTTEHKMAAAEKAKQRKEEEEKRFEESRSKKTNKDISDFHSSLSSSYAEWDKEERTKSSENFRQMTQFPLEARSNMNRVKGRDRDMRGDRGERDNQFRYQTKPPRFQKEAAQKTQQYGGVFEKSWNHNSFRRGGGPDQMDKDDDYRKDRHDRPSPSDSGPDRFRLNMRDERSMDSNKRNYCDSSHMDYSQSSFQSNREADKDKDLNKDFDYRMSDKDSSSRDMDKEWESPKGDNEPRSFHEIRRNKPLNDNSSKQTSDHFEDKDNEWHPQRPENRQPDKLDLRERHDRDGRSDHRIQDNRIEMKHDIRDLRNDSRFDRPDRLDNRLNSRGDYRSLDNRDSSRLDTRYDRENRLDIQDNRLDTRDRYDNRDNRPENLDSARSDIRPSRPDSRDSRASRDSRNSKDSSDKPLLMEDYPMPESYLNDKMERLSFKEKEIRHDPILRGRDHMPGPITQEKLVAYEHKHNQSQLEKSDIQEKDTDDKKGKKLNEGETVTLAWGEPRDDKTTSFPESSLTPQEPLTRNEFPIDECKSLIKGDDMDKKKDNGGGMRERRDDKPGSGGGRGNRNRGASRSGGYPSSSKYNAYSAPNWQNKDRQQRQNSSRGHGKHWNQSESDISGDEISAESGKDDKKLDSRKQDSSPKFSTWKGESKEKRDEKKDMKMTGSESDKERSKGDKKMSGGLGDGFRKGGDGGNFAPRPTGEPSKRGRGGGGMRGQSRVCMGQAMYGPPGSKPFSSSSGGQPQSNPHSLSLDPQDKLNSSQQSGRKDDGQSGNKGRDNDKGLRGKPGGGGIRSQDENWETTSETSDGSDAKKSNKNRNKFDKKSRGTIGDKRNLINSCSGHLNGRPDSKPDDSGNEKKPCKDDSDTTGYSNNGFQEVKSKKIGREGRGAPGNGTKEETKRSQSKGSKDKSGGGVKSQLKSYTREFVNHKPPRLQRTDNKCKLQQQQVPSSQDVSDMNKINQSVSSLFPLPKSSNDVTSNSCPPPPPTHNAWNKPINASLRTTPPLPSPLTQLTVASAQITTDKSNIEELGQPVNTVPASSPTADKSITKMTREVVEKSHLEGPPVNTIIFENTNYKRDPGDMGMKTRYPKTPSRTPLDKTRERKIEDELAESNHGMGMGLSGFKSATELQASEGKPQDNIQVPISFGKNEDNADMKLDFAFDTDLSQLSDDKTNQSMHVGQSSTADLNQKIASVKKVWDTPPSSMSGHVDEGTTSSFTQGFTTDKSLDPSAPSHHNDHTDFNTADSVYGSSQLSGAGAYVAAGSPMMKPDTIVSNANTMCKTNMFQVSPQPQQVVLPHPGPLSTPPLPNVISYQPGYSNSLSAVPSPPNVVYNSQQAAGPQTEIYQTYSLSAGPIHGNGSRSYPDYSSFNMSQNSSFQPNVYIQPAPPAPQSVFQNPNQYRIPPHGSAALSQQMNSNPSTILMSSSSNSVVSGNQVKSTQGSMQPTAIGSKSGGGPPTAAFAPASTQILLIEPPPVSFIHQSFHRPTALQHSSSYYTSNSALAAGGSSGGLFNSLSSGGTGATTANLPSASPFGVQAPGSYSQQQPPSSAQPPSHHQQPPYPTQQPQMVGSFRTQTGYPKSGQHPSDTVKSSSADQFPNMFSSSVQGSAKARIGGVKPQPQPSASPQSQHKFTYNANSQSVSQANIGYQQNSAGNGSSRQSQVVASQSSRYIAPIQRPMGPSYSQQQAAAMIQQQVQARQQAQHRLQQQQQPPQHQGRSAPPQQPPKQYYQQQGGGMKLEGSDAVKNEVDDPGKASQDKSSKDESPSEQ